MHDKGAHETGEFCRDRELSVATDLDSNGKKKKRPSRFGVSQFIIIIVTKNNYYNYLFYIIKIEYKINN